MRRAIGARTVAAAVIAVLGCLLAACGGTGGAGGTASTGGPTTSAPVTASPTPAVPAITSYVALGDSYTSAPGVPITDGNNVCLRSDHDYPHLVAAALHVHAFADASCSGAETKDVTGSQYAGTPPQLDAVHTGTQAVSIGLGGNDVGVFDVIIDECPQLRSSDPTGEPCTQRTRAWVRAAIPTIERRLVAVVHAVVAKAPHAQVLLVGYPSVVPAGGTCAALPIAPGDYPYVRQVNRWLDGAVAAAARATGATYVDLWGPSRGHDLCADHPWVNGPHFSSRAIPFHPFPAEQRAVARLVERDLLRGAGSRS
jgi:hypothetical protein